MTGSNEPLLVVRHVSKFFPGQRALDDVMLSFGRGQVHSLIGHNGSGKSTMVKVLAGYHHAETGIEVEYRGARLADGVSALHAADRIRILHQEIGLIPRLSVIENLALGRGYRKTRLGAIAWGAERRRVRDMLAEYNLVISPSATVASLHSAERSVLGLIRALEEWEPADGLLILDEPTASMPATETRQLFNAVRQVATAGAAVLFVSHRLDEVLAISDHITVLRNGKVVTSLPNDGLDEDRLAVLMVGAAAGAGQRRAATAAAAGEVVVEVEQVSGLNLRPCSFTARRGEILGVAGLVGSGRDELVPLLVGDAVRFTGRLRVDGSVVPQRPNVALRAGVAVVPADRKSKALFLHHTVGENVMLLDLRSCVKFGWLSTRAVNQQARANADRMQVEPKDPHRTMGLLSGGNQQKVVLGRALAARPRVLIIEEPTQGVDVGAKALIYDFIRQAVDGGTVVIVCSSDEDELANICDRVLVMARGRIVAEVTADQLTRQELERLSLAN